MTEKLKKWMEQIEAQQDREFLCAEQIGFLVMVQKIQQEVE